MTPVMCPGGRGGAPAKVGLAGHEFVALGGLVHSSDAWPSCPPSRARRPSRRPGTWHRLCEPRRCHQRDRTCGLNEARSSKPIRRESGMSQATGITKQPFLGDMVRRPSVPRRNGALNLCEHRYAPRYNSCRPGRRTRKLITTSLVSSIATSHSRGYSCAGRSEHRVTDSDGRETV